MVPPVALAVASLSDPPLQLTSSSTDVDATTAAGSDMVTLSVSVQLFASVAVTVYVPADKPVIVPPVPLLLHAYVFVPVPPVALAVADPSVAPLQLAFVPEILALTDVGSSIVTLSVSLQPLASVAVTVYVPAAKPVIVAPVPLLLQTYVIVPVPPVALAGADPSVAPLQLASVPAILALTAVGSSIVTLSVSVQPLASVAVTV